MPPDESLAQYTGNRPWRRLGPWLNSQTRVVEKRYKELDGKITVNQINLIPVLIDELFSPQLQVRYQAALVLKKMGPAAISASSPLYGI